MATQCIQGLPQRAAAAGLALAALSSEAFACPNCKFALETESTLPQAYMTSILFMLGMMGLVTGSVVFLLFKLNQYEKKQLEQLGYQHLFENGVTSAPPGP